MHGPDGANYWNESVFADIHPPDLIVIRHVCEPRFTLTDTLSPCAAGTHLTWLQDFENPDVACRMEPILRPCNEQNLDRLTAELLHRSGGGPASDSQGA